MDRFKLLFLSLFSFSLAALVWGVLLFFLEKRPIFYDYIKKEYSFYRIDLTHLFFSNVKPSAKKKSEAVSLKDIKLKAIYKNRDGGFILIEDNRKNIFVDLNQSYNDYKLIEIGEDFAIFKKDGKRYKIEFQKAKKRGEDSYKAEDESNVKIPKDTFIKYKKDLKSVWKNIGIVKTRDGYKVTFINPKSIFAKIGLKRGDILLEINGVELKSDSDAWELYKNIDKLDFVELKVKRKNSIKVLNYEIN